jgi:hypothetical protein
MNLNISQDIVTLMAVLSVNEDLDWENSRWFYGMFNDSDVHHGDCVGIAMTCSLCVMENLLEEANNLLKNWDDIVKRESLKFCDEAEKLRFVVLCNIAMRERDCKINHDHQYNCRDLLKYTQEEVYTNWKSLDDERKEYYRKCAEEERKMVIEKIDATFS